MNDLNRKAFTGLMNLIVVLALLLFLPAWTIDYWQAWIFLAVFSVSVLAITIYLMKEDPKLLERRGEAGPAGQHPEEAQDLQPPPTAATRAAPLVTPHTPALCPVASP